MLLMLLMPRCPLSKGHLVVRVMAMVMVPMLPWHLLSEGHLILLSRLRGSRCRHGLDKWPGHRVVPADGRPRLWHRLWPRLPCPGRGYLCRTRASSSSLCPWPLRMLVRCLLPWPRPKRIPTDIVKCYVIPGLLLAALVPEDQLRFSVATSYALTHGYSIYVEVAYAGEVVGPLDGATTRVRTPAWCRCRAENELGLV